MAKLEIESPDDWIEVSDNLRKLYKTMPHFYNDFVRIRKNLDEEIKKLCEIEIKLRKGESKHYRDLRQEQIDKINTVLRTFSKQHLIATLSKR